MEEKTKIIKCRPYPLGCVRTGTDIRFSAEFTDKKNAKLLLYSLDPNNKIKGKLSFDLDESFFYGNICSIRIEDVPVTYTVYSIFENGVKRPDPYATGIIGLENFGAKCSPSSLLCKIAFDDSNYGNKGQSSKLMTPYENSFFYLLNVRAYTMSPSSGLPKELRGTFKGLESKIDYIKSLGCTAVELMPVYEMPTVFNDETTRNMMVNVSGTMQVDEKSQKTRLNLWGYTDGFYFAPKSSYSSDKNDPKTELIHMIETFHDNSMEVIFQFYFDAGTKHQFILDVIRYWVTEYDIDGIHLKGADVPSMMIAKDPLLSDIKIMDYGFDTRQIYSAMQTPGYTNISEYNDNFECLSRKFLKGDDNTLNGFLASSYHADETKGQVNYICNYDGFRLCDLVSYEHKCNYDNGENNADGNDENFSWNCGVEGLSRKKSITELRDRQVRNILTMLFMAQGTPMIYGGDEFLDSQAGNNNPYCQDNNTGWVNWAKQKHGNEITEYIRFLSKLKFSHAMLHQKKSFRLMDYKTLGYPDFSYHGTYCYRPDMSNYSHSIGILFCGLYDDDGTFFYVIYNMHWKSENFSLPELPNGMEWKIIADTQNGYFGYDGLESKLISENADKRKVLVCSERSTYILESIGKPIIQKSNKDKIKKVKSKTKEH